MSEHTFVVSKSCPVCGKNVNVVKVKSRLAAIKVDNDYCCHYKDFNPYLYHIWVCDGCGFAADERVFLTSLPPAKRELIGNALLEKHVHFEFHEERDVPDGVAAMKLAIFCAEVLKAPLARQAGLVMRLAWIYRIDSQKEKEKEAMEQAVSLYVRSLETEHYPIGHLTDDMVIYLIGALYAELGERQKAALYLGNLMGDKNNSMVDPKLAKDARRLWQEVREEGKEQEQDEAHKDQAASKHASAASNKASAQGGSSKAKKKSSIRSWF